MTRSLLLPLILFALFLTVVMQLVGAPLATAVAPAGIVSFEFAGSQEQAAAIIASWDDIARLHAALSLGLDYLYLVVYAAAIGLTASGIAHTLATYRPWLAQIGRLLAWGLGVAAVLDTVENLALIRLLLGSDLALWPSLAWWCAALKFTLVALGLLYVLGAGLLALWSQRQAGPTIAKT